MLIPQYSIRRLMALTAGCALVALIVARGVSGKAWAIGFTAGFAALALAFLVYAAAFAGVWLFSRITTSGRRDPQDLHPSDGPAPLEQV